DVVARAAADCAASGGLLIQDTAWPGYEQVPQWIVDGYSTLFEEADAQLAGTGAVATVVAVPIGVGSLAQAAVRHYRSAGSATSVLGVEPEHAPAVLESLHRGEPVTVPTQPSIMAGLCCGTVSSIAWPVLRDGMDTSIAVSESDAARAVHDLSDLGLDAGPSGASTLAGVRGLAATAPLRADATVLLLATEGMRANPLPSQM